MAEFVYFSASLLSVVYAFLLFRGYRSSRSSLLLYASICFAFLALNNVFTFFDLVIFAEIDLHGRMVRNSLLAAAGGVMLTGLIWELK